MFVPVIRTKTIVDTYETYSVATIAILPLPAHDYYIFLSLPTLTKSLLLVHTY